MNQNKVGKRTEDKITNNFKKDGYLCLNIPKSIYGQPFDMVAIKEKEIWLVDAKHLIASKNVFAFERIESNQITSMHYAHSFAKVEGNIGFIIEWDKTNKFYFLNYELYLEEKRKGEKSIAMNRLKEIW